MNIYKVVLDLEMWVDHKSKAVYSNNILLPFVGKVNSLGFSKLNMFH